MAPNKRRTAASKRAELPEAKKKKEEEAPVKEDQNVETDNKENDSGPHFYIEHCKS